LSAPALRGKSRTPRLVVIRRISSVIEVGSSFLSLQSQ
jgi:hypothetical protein